MSRWLRKIIVKLRMSYADIRGHHGKKWNYEPGDHYMGRRKRKMSKFKVSENTNVQLPLRNLISINCSSS